VIKSTGSTEARVYPECGSGNCIGDVPKEPRQWQAFEFADQMEQGLAPGLTSSYIATLEGNEAAEERLFVMRSENSREYLLATQENAPLLLAVRDSSGQRFDIYITRAGQPPSALGPAFLLESSSATLNDWSLKSIRCERCQSRGRRSCGVRELACIRHYVEAVGEGKALCMDVDIPGHPSAEEHECAVWCSVCSDLQPEEESPVIALSSRRPKWSPKHRTLTLNFNGRCSLASSKNFQLEMCGDQAPVGMKLLFGKASARSFVLDYKRPLGMVQAFAAALTASHWQ